MITTEEKIKFIKSTETTKRYIYHRCTKSKKDTACVQKPIKHEKLIEQIKAYLDSITIPQEFLEWSLEVLRDQNKLEETDRNTILKNQHKNYQNCVKRIDNLINLYISPENSDKELLSEEEFKERKNSLVKEKNLIGTEMRKTENRVDEWLELTEKTFNFATYAKHWFEQGDFETKTQILGALGQNFYLQDGKLTIELEKPYLMIKTGLERQPLEKGILEPRKFGLKETKSSHSEEVFSTWSG